MLCSSSVTSSGAPRRGQHGCGVQRLERMHAEDSGGDAFLGQKIGGLDRRPQHAAGGDDGQVRAVAEGNGLAERPGERFLVDVGFAGPAQAEIDGTDAGCGGADGGRGLQRVAGGNDLDLRQAAEDRQVLGGVMAHAQRAVGEAPAHRRDHHVGLVIADVVADLLQAAERGEVADRVGEDDAAGQGHAGRHARHVLLGHAGVEKLVGKALGEVGDDAEPQVAHHQSDAGIALGHFRDRLDERGPHGAPSISAIARWYSSPCGVR